MCLRQPIPIIMRWLLFANRRSFARSFVRSLGVIDKIELGFNFGNEKEEN